mgnify:CR=1 FL=1
MPENKHLLSIFIMGSEVRQFVHAGLFSLLLDKGWKITVMAKVIDQDLPDQLPPSVNLVPLLNSRPPFLPHEVTKIIDRAFITRRKRKGYSTWKYGKTQTKNWRQNLLLSFEKASAFFLSLTNWGMSLASKIEKVQFKRMDRGNWEKYFRSHSIDAVLINVPRQAYWDPMLTTAQEMGVKTFLIYHTAKDIVANGRLNHRFSSIGVWNDSMKRDLLELNPWIDPKTVSVVGSGHFDCVGRAEWLPQEPVFRNQIKADPDSHLIIYACAGPGIVPQEERYIAFVMHAIEKAEIKLGEKIQVVFRLNPMDNRDILYDHLKQTYPDHIVLRPDWVDIRKSNWTYAKKPDTIFYNALLHYASVCVTIPSTVTIDAALSGLPVINLGIEVPGEQPLAGSIRAFWEVAFNKNVRETDAAKFVTTQEDLEEELTNYLENKHHDADKRIALISKEVEGIQGGQSSKLSSIMIEELTYIK